MVTAPGVEAWRPARKGPRLMPSNIRDTAALQWTLQKENCVGFLGDLSHRVWPIMWAGFLITGAGHGQPGINSCMGRAPQMYDVLNRKSRMSGQSFALELSYQYKQPTTQSIKTPS